MQLLPASLTYWSHKILHVGDMSQVEPRLQQLQQHLGVPGGLADAAAAKQLRKREQQQQQQRCQGGGGL
jgi:hypothetical protein